MSPESGRGGAHRGQEVVEVAPGAEVVAANHPVGGRVVGLGVRLREHRLVHALHLEQDVARRAQPAQMGHLVRDAARQKCSFLGQGSAVALRGPRQTFCA